MTETTTTTQHQELDINAVLKALPHRWPFLLIDRAVITEPGKKVTGYKYVTINETFFQGHFPGHPIMPGVLIIESLAQAACALMLGSPQFAGKLAFFMGMDQVKFRAPVTPVCYLEQRVELLRAGSRAGKARGESWINGTTLAAQGEFTFALVDK